MEPLTETAIDHIRPPIGFTTDKLEADADGCARKVAVYRHDALGVPAEEVLAVAGSLPVVFVLLMKALDHIGRRLAEQRNEINHRAFNPKVTDGELARCASLLVTELECALADARGAQAAAEKLASDSANSSSIAGHG